AELPAPDPILADAFDLGTKALIVGPSKARKSFFMLQMLLSLAAGSSHFLSWRIPRARRVLLLNLEIPPAHFQARIKRMMLALNISPEMLGDRFHVVNARGMEPSDSLQSQIVERVNALQVEVLAVDPFYKLVSGDESAQEEIKPLLRMFDQLANKTNCAVLYSHHGQKGMSGDRQTIDRASGSGVIARDFDWMASLCHHQSHKDTGLLVCEQIARSYPPKDAFSMAWDDAGYFTVSDQEPVLLTSRNADRSGKSGPGLTVDDALAISVARGPMLASLFQEELRAGGFTARSARTVTDQLVESGRIAKRSIGFPCRVYIGERASVDALIHKLKNPELTVTT
ncbi:MAG: AAA family ATPase, partial [bacterium]